jgi:hypothetical protein
MLRDLQQRVAARVICGAHKYNLKRFINSRHETERANLLCPSRVRIFHTQTAYLCRICCVVMWLASFVVLVFKVLRFVNVKSIRKFVCRLERISNPDRIGHKWPNKWSEQFDHNEVIRTKIKIKVYPLTILGGNVSWHPSSRVWSGYTNEWLGHSMVCR